MGRIPGVLEEVLLSLRAGQPVYLVGGFGAATAFIFRAIGGEVCEELTWEYQRQAPHAEGIRRIYEQEGVPFEDYPEMTDWLKKCGLDGLSANNRLTKEENIKLSHTKDLFRILELLLQGLTRATGTGP